MDKVVVQQDNEYRMAVMVKGEADDELHQVAHIHELSPYTMMLASLALCTTSVLHSYAHHHEVGLELAEITATYHREESDDDQPYDEWIEEHVAFNGELSEQDLDRLTHVAHACSIRKMLASGIEVKDV